MRVAARKKVCACSVNECRSMCLHTGVKQEVSYLDLSVVRILICQVTGSHLSYEEAPKPLKGSWALHRCCCSG